LWRGFPEGVTESLRSLGAITPAETADKVYNRP